MNKLLHEKLREITESKHCLYCVKSLLGDDNCPDCTCDDCVRQVAQTLADEIEKYYIPRPRFEDGEPVQFGDVFSTEIGNVECVAIEYNQYNAWVKDNTDNDWSASILADKLAKINRLPKVLDADGVEIKVGDTVFENNSPIPLKVVTVYGDGDICAVGDRGICSKLDSSNYSHRKPDSLEKLRDDMNYSIIEGTYPGTAHEYLCQCAKRLTAIMERDA